MERETLHPHDAHAGTLSNRGRRGGLPQFAVHADHAALDGAGAVVNRRGHGADLPDQLFDARLWLPGARSQNQPHQDETDDGTVTEVYWQGPNPPQQGTLSHFESRILAITGYSSGDGYQHVIVATDDGDLTEVYWQTGAPARGTLIHLETPVVDLAGYEADGVHHIIAAGDDGTLTEITWDGTAPTAGTLAPVEAQPWNHVLGVGAYQSAQEQHLIVAMSNGALREFHTPPGGGQALHTDLAIVPGIMPIIDAYTDASGDQHTIFATSDGAVHELWWSPEGSPIVNPIPPTTIHLAASR